MPNNLKTLLDLFTSDEYRLYLIETLKNYESVVLDFVMNMKPLILCRPLKTNKEVYDILLNEYRQYFHIETIQSKEDIKNPENQLSSRKDSKDNELNIPMSTTSKVNKICFLI